MSFSLRQLSTGDEAQLTTFLRAQLETTMILLSNFERAGFAAPDQRYGATYFAAFAQDRIVAVVAHTWNGRLLVQGSGASGSDSAGPSSDTLVQALARAAVRHSTRAVAGILGPVPDVHSALAALHMRSRPTTISSAERLYRLKLSELKIPQLLGQPEVQCRCATAADRRAFVGQWRFDYAVEALNHRPTEALRAQIQQRIEESDNADVWILWQAGQPVSMTSFNAETCNAVQVGGVWTPRQLRGRGYARAVVAGSLLDRQALGAELSFLFTDQTNVSAQQVYAALGYALIGEYGLWEFA